MAHFLQNGRRISGETIELDFRRHVDIGLWGYRDYSGADLVVAATTVGLVTADRRNTQGENRIWRITAGTEAGETTIEARTTSGDVWDKFQLRVLSHGTHVAEQRRAVIAEAERHLGSHYLWGAAGAKPDGWNGMPARRNSVDGVTDRLDPHDPCLHAASCSVDGLHVCAGRYQEVGGRVLSPHDAALKRYLDGLRGQTPDRWQPMEGQLWPRMMEGHTVTRQIVLGESCDDVRHFDCIGFINYCLSVVLRRSIQDSIQGWIKNSPEVTDATDEAGDILTIGNHHIGFAMGNGWAIHASQASKGVVRSAVGHGIWQRRGRFLR